MVVAVAAFGTADEDTAMMLQRRATPNVPKPGVLSRLAITEMSLEMV